MGERKRGDPRQPPAWLPEQRLPLVPPRLEWYRCALTARPLIDWDNRSDSRFGGPTLPFRSLYLASDSVTGFWESFGDELLDREPGLRSVSAKARRERSIVKFTLPGSLRILDVMSADTQRLIGADGSIFRSRYEITQPWAAALMRHPDQPDGLVCSSRLNADAPCLALFDRPGIEAWIGTKLLHSLEHDGAVRFEMIQTNIAVDFD